MFHLISDDESDDQEENLFFITHLTPPPPAYHSNRCQNTADNPTIPGEEGRMSPWVAS